MDSLNHRSIMRDVTRLLFALALISLSIPSQATDFRNLGPEGGCPWDLTIGSLPSNPETLYAACVNGGIYYFPLAQNWTSGSWTALREEISFHSLALFKDKNARRVLLGGTIRSGLWRTESSSLTDQNFLKIGGTGLSQYISFTSIASYRLSDGGCDTVYAVCDYHQQTEQGDYGNGIYRSINAGSAWLPSVNLTDPNFEDLHWTKVYADAHTRGTAYALCTKLRNYTGIWKTTDAGQNWTRLDYDCTNDQFPPLGEFFDEFTEVECFYQSPNQYDTLYFCAKRGGGPVTTASYAGPWGVPAQPGQDESGSAVIGMIDMNPPTPSWTPLDGYPEWLPVKGSIYVKDDPSGSDTIWVSVNEGGVWMGVGTIPTSLTWTQKVTDLYAWSPRSFIHDLGCLDGSNANFDTLFFGTWIAGVWGSSNAASSWQEINKGMKNADSRTFCLDASGAAYKIYTASVTHGIRRTTDYGATWEFWGEESDPLDRARFNRQFNYIILNPFAAGTQLLVGMMGPSEIRTQTSLRRLPAGLYYCTSTRFGDATDGSISNQLKPTYIDTVVSGTDAIYVCTGAMPSVGGTPTENQLFRVVGSTTLGDPPYSFTEVQPQIPYNLAILSVLIDRDDPTRQTCFLGLGDLLLTEPGAVIYGPISNQWQTIISPTGDYTFKNMSFNHFRQHPASVDTIFASSKGWPGIPYGALAQEQWGCLLQIFQDDGFNWHYWDISPPVSETGGPFRDNAILGFDVRERNNYIEIIAAALNNHNIPPNSGNFQPEVHIIGGYRNTTGPESQPWTWFPDVIPELVTGQDFNSMGVQDVRFAAQADSVYLVSIHGVTRYDISGLSWP